ncbi:MAG: hypothetical protein M3Y03_05210 [Verrucomicrobiota bacterium]|nr:hypothetical protein [Verrucomicrobiota bacterium]
MAAKRLPNEQLFRTNWVHVHEEDTPEGRVYRPEEDDIPLSRRPRARLRLEADGAAWISVPGANDGYVEQPAAWTDEAGILVVRSKADETELRVVSQSPSRLLVRRGGDNSG